MHDVEHHTVCYLRDLLATPAHGDPEITTFLTLWAHEELWHGEALAAVLAAHDVASGRSRVRSLRGRLGRMDRLRPAAMTLASAVVGRASIAVHMTWGAVNEWTTQAGYVRLAQRSGHPVLAELTRRIARQEGRHIDFYASQAEERLDCDPLAQRAVRWALRRLWRPVGSGVMPAAETRFVVRHLFGADGMGAGGGPGPAMARRIDERIQRLPGLAGLEIVSAAAAA
jgi:hypothetical protein